MWTNQVVVGEPHDLVLQAGLHAGLLGQQEGLGQHLLLLLLLAAQLVQLLLQLPGLLAVSALLLLHLLLQKPEKNRAFLSSLVVVPGCFICQSGTEMRNHWTKSKNQTEGVQITNTKHRS